VKLVSFSAGDGEIRPGALREESNLIVDLTAAGCNNTLEAIAAGIREVPREPGVYAGHRLSDVRIHAPLANPPRIFAIGLNYREHATESGLTLPDYPVVFFKLQTGIIGPGDPIGRGCRARRHARIGEPRVQGR